jgi:hypothetical protein
MHNTSQLFLLLLNIYFNLGMINPYLHRAEIAKLSHITSEFLGIELPFSETPEAKIDRLMQEYVNKLAEVEKLQNDKDAIRTMQNARTTFMERAKEIQPQLRQWLESMPVEDAAAQKESLLMKPYFKNINDMLASYQLSNKLDANHQMQQSLEAMDDFLTVLYE